MDSDTQIGSASSGFHAPNAPDQRIVAPAVSSGPPPVPVTEQVPVVAASIEAVAPEPAVPVLAAPDPTAVVPPPSPEVMETLRAPIQALLNPPEPTDEPGSV